MSRTIPVPIGRDTRRTGTRQVPITHEQDGLALQRALEGTGWLIVHVASGYRVTPTYPRQAEARAVQRALLALAGLDWTCSAGTLRRLPQTQRAQVVACVTGRDAARQAEGGPGG